MRGIPFACSIKLSDYNGIHFQHAINVNRISAYTESRARSKDVSRGGPSNIKVAYNAS